MINHCGLQGSRIPLIAKHIIVRWIQHVGVPAEIKIVHGNFDVESIRIRYGSANERICDLNFSSTGNFIIHSTGTLMLIRNVINQWRITRVRAPAPVYAMGIYVVRNMIVFFDWQSMNYFIMKMILPIISSLGQIYFAVTLPLVGPNMYEVCLPGHRHVVKIKFGIIIATVNIPVICRARHTGRFRQTVSWFLKFK